MKSSLLEIARRAHSNDPGTKGPYYYRRCEKFFEDNSFKPTGILEIGVYKGESTGILAEAYRRVTLELRRRGHLVGGPTSGSGASSNGLDPTA